MKGFIGFIVQGEGMLLFKKNNELPVYTDLQSIAPHFLRRFELGSFNEISYFCAELDPKALIPETFHIISLRNTLSLLNCDYYRIAIKAYSVIRWDKNHQFCSCWQPHYT